MITFVDVDGRHCPMVLCDWCGQRIAKATEGNALWFMAKDREEVLSVTTRDRMGRPVRGQIFFTHKHCDWPWEQVNHALLGDLSLSSDLDVFLFELTWNCPFDRRKAEHCSRLLMMI